METNEIRKGISLEQLYHCPMHCEGDKVYDESGNCPVCNMNLVANDSHKHNHSKNHGHETEHVHKKTVAEKTGAKYYCPMLCEGDKTYDEPGDCPECGMHLKTSGIIEQLNTRYTCSMHPEINLPKPGDCPKCGMTMVPVIPTEDNPEEKEYQSMLKKFWISVIFTLPVFLIAMLDMVKGAGLEELFPIRTWNWIQMVLSVPVVFYAGGTFFKRGISSVRRRSFNMWTLISLGVGAAFGFSVFGLLFPGVFPDQFKDELGNVLVYFEAATVILTLVIIGQVLELKAHSKTNSAIKALLNLSPPTAIVVKNGEEKEIPLEHVVENDILRVKPGGKIPVDGSISTGKATIDESMITGESISVEKTKGDMVLGGTINGKSSFEMKAEKVGSDTLLSQIINMVNEASRSKAPIQKLADKVSEYFVPIVISVSIVTFFVWAIWGPDPAYVYGFVNAISVLIIACPCALGLATPISVMVGTGRAAQSGILIKEARVIEEMNKIDTLIIDKTGTITEGKPSLNTVFPLDVMPENQILQFAASINVHSEHPLADAIVAGAKEKEIELLEVVDFESVTGKGAIAQLNGVLYGIGNSKLLELFDVSLGDNQRLIAEKYQKMGDTAMFLVTKNSVKGIISVTDKIKNTSAKAIRTLQDMGVHVHMLTGDNKLTARNVANKLQLDGYQAECLPEDKFRIVKEFQEKGKTVAMAGDGINDAPALAQANIGIAMGTGTDIAMQSAEITLVKGDLTGIVRARDLSKKVMQNIKQNMFFAFIYNILGVPLAAGILFPFFGIFMSPMLAAVAMSFSSVSVIANALRLKNS